MKRTIVATARHLFAPRSSHTAASKYTTTSTTTAPPDVEVIVIGAGVVGLAIARQLAIISGRRDVLVIEAADKIGTETSSRNSEVIHAGIYYPPCSLKSQLCVKGKHLLYKYCTDHDIPHRRLGKLLVATADEQIPALHRLQETAAENGVTDLKLLSKEEVKALETQVESVAALFSPSTGILDSHAYMISLRNDIETVCGGGSTSIAFNSRVIGGDVSGPLKSLLVEDTTTIATGGGGGGGGGASTTTSITSKVVINAAGLHAQRVATSLKGLPATSIPPLHLAKGNYFQLKRGTSSSSEERDFRHLIYPMPSAAGLGIHLTLDLSGGVRFGPDVEWIPSSDSFSDSNSSSTPENDDFIINHQQVYQVDPRRASDFEAAIKRYIPGLPTGCLVPGYSGIRPKVVGPGEPAADFMVVGPAQHGVAGVVSLFGIESPGLTASLALAQHVVERLE